MAQHREEWLTPRYRVKERRGGGMGVVFICEDVQRERQLVALKTYLDDQGDEQLRESFIREAETWLRLHGSEYVATIEGIDLIELRPFIRMPYYPGGSLAQVLQQQGPLPIARVLELTAQIILGLIHICGRASLIHQDLKPANILIGNQGQALIADFGLTRKAVQPERVFAHGTIDVREATRPGVAGTLPYMAPEQLRAEPLVSTQVDVYALGLIIFEMVVGTRAFDERDVSTLVGKIRQRRIDAWSSFVSRAPKRLVAFVERCIATDPAKRFANFDAVATALDADLLTGYGDPPQPSVLQSLRGDTLLSIQGTRVAEHWSHDYRPHAMKGAYVSVKTTEYLLFHQAVELRKLNKPREAMERLEQILGSPANPSARFEDIWRVDDQGGDMLQPVADGRWTLRLTRAHLAEALGVYLAAIADLFYEHHEMSSAEGATHEAFARALLKRGCPTFKLTELCGQLLLQRGSLLDAADAFLDAYKAAPRGTPSVLACLVTVYSQIGDRTTLERVVHKFVLPELSGDESALAQRTCGTAMQTLYHFDKAIEFYDRALALNTDPWVIKQAAICAFNAKRFSLAQQYRDRLAKLLPGSDHLIQLDRVLRQTG